MVQFHFLHFTSCCWVVSTLSLQLSFANLPLFQHLQLVGLCNIIHFPCNCFSRPPGSDFLATYLASMALWDWEERFHNSITHAPIIILKLVAYRARCQVWLQTWDGRWPLVYHLWQFDLLFVSGSRQLAIGYRVSWVWCCPEGSFCFIPIQIRPLLKIIVSFIWSLGWNIRLLPALFSFKLPILEILYFFFCVSFFVDLHNSH